MFPPAPCPVPAVRHVPINSRGARNNFVGVNVKQLLHLRHATDVPLPLHQRDDPTLEIKEAGQRRPSQQKADRTREKGHHPEEAGEGQGRL